MSLDLRKLGKTAVAPANPAPPAGSVPAPAIFRNGQLPLSPGSSLILSPEEQATLDSLGWAKGDPVPDVASLVDRIKSEAPDLSHISQLPAVVASPVDITTLPKAEQDRLKAAMAESIDQLKRLNEAEARQIPNTQTPDVNRAAEELLTGTATQVDMSETPALSTAAKVPELCPNCGFKHDVDVLEVSDSDKSGFLAMLIGGARFKKVYPLLGGKLTIVFRSLTREELELSLQQASYDDRDGLFATQYEYFRTHRNYEMVLALDRIEAGDSLDVFPAPADVKWDAPLAGQPSQTVLSVYYPHVVETHFKSASILRMVSLLYERFTGLIRRLEANMQNPDFWKGIA